MTTDSSAGSAAAASASGQPAANSPMSLMVNAHPPSLFTLPSPGKLLGTSFDMMRSPTVEPTHVHPLHLGQSPHMQAIQQTDYYGAYGASSDPYGHLHQPPQPQGQQGVVTADMTDRLTHDFQHAQMMAGTPPQMPLSISTASNQPYGAELGAAHLMPATPLYLPPSSQSTMLGGSMPSPVKTPRSARKVSSKRQQAGAAMDPPMMQVQPSLAEQRKEKRRARNRVYAKGSRDRKRQALQEKEAEFEDARAEIAHLRAEVEKWRSIALQQQASFALPKGMTGVQTSDRREKALA